MQDVEAICICPLVLNLVPAESSLIVTWPLPGDSAGINVGQQNAAIFNVIRIKARRSEWMFIFSSLLKSYQSHILLI